MFEAEGTLYAFRLLIQPSAGVPMNPVARRHPLLARLAAAAALTAVATVAAAQTKWDLPAAYPATNFHTENLQQFANDVDKATGGKLKITVHANASLFKAPEIKRAVATGQAQMGEVLISIHENEDPVYGVDTVPFLAASFPEAMNLYKASKPAISRSPTRPARSA